MEQESVRHVSRKIKSVEELVREIGPRPRARKVIMCHGTFDVVHPGHVRHLLYAKSKADILVASITADMHVSKANLRPYVPEDLRAVNLAAFEMVDYVVVDRNPTPIENLAKIQPDYFAKGYEYVAGAQVHPKTQKEIEVLESYGGEFIYTPGDVVYSSSSLIEKAPPSIAVDKLLMLLEAEGLGFADLRAALNKFKRLRIHVLGDTIVDTFTYGSVIGGMTKTPTISVRFEHKTDYVGGAGVVAKHLRAAGADVTFSTVLGNDAHKDFVLKDLRDAGITVLPVIDQTRPTTNKNAIIAGGYRMLKVDTLDNRSISEKIVGQFRHALGKIKVDGVVLSDFRHGIFNRTTIPQLIASIPEGVFRVADSQVASRWGNILDFEGFDLITPNEREARFSLGDQDSVVRPLALELFRRSKSKTLILKLGERGIITYRSSATDDHRAFLTVDSFADHVVDAVGAGDSLLAYATLAMIATGNEVIASVLGSFAAGIE
ncbi:MAG: adenylyltransferase/cytidyltransferase family protein, partial [Alphaproteobacteria bacterium]|nr:adenylyltransferase/cytidyltransferase family protein [Alphaproteobacteria bacterium]